MKNIRIRGLRSLKDSGTVELKPLTLLLGENSSGKSTFLRTLPLLRQSLEAATRGPILWFGSYVDFGSFEEAVSHYSESRTIDFTFSADLAMVRKTVPPRYYIPSGVTGNEDFIGTLSLDGNNKEGHTRVKAVKFEHNDNNICVTFSKNNKVQKVTSNGIDLSSYFSNVVIESEKDAYSIFPWITFANGSNRTFSRYFERHNEEVLAVLSSKIQKYAHGKSNPDKLLARLNKTGNQPIEEFINTFQELSPTDTWKKRTANISSTDPNIHEIHALLFASRLGWLMNLINASLVNELANVQYVAPLRATAERYYRNQDLSIDEVDFQGKNLAMFIKNLGDRKKDYQKWMLDNFGFYLVASSNGGHLSLRIHYSDSHESYNVTDMGFGFSQILPILTQLWFSSINQPQNNGRFTPGSINKYLVIEQPELHLHPRFQAKMVDVFIKVINYVERHNSNSKLKIIIETHSETIVNQIGHRIAYRNKVNKRYDNLRDKVEELLLDEDKDDYETFKIAYDSSISHDDVSIVIFDKLRPNEPTEVTHSKFDNDGNLIDWPWGFFEPELVL
ncbi:AAA family ATPase [Vibrio rotiferianus]|uniref:AAA family ATPase n=1 Tax=Vibrio rotiferianus TaxID=190895 RepID=UPI00406A5E12